MVEIYAVSRAAGIVFLFVVLKWLVKPQLMVFFSPVTCKLVQLLLCHQGDAKVASLFTGEEELFAFERVVSRMTEMCTAAYWAHAEELRKR